MFRWRHESDALRAAISAGRGKPSDAEIASKDTIPFGMILCPFCGRKFSEKSGERHILSCEHTKARPTALKKGSRKV